MAASFSQGAPAIIGIGDNTRLNAISADGSTACGALGAEPNVAPIRWKAATGIQVLPSNPKAPGDASIGEAYALSADGEVVAGRVFYHPTTATSGFSAAKWDAAGKVTLIPYLSPRPSSGIFSAAYGISQDGKIVVGSSNTTGGTRSWQYSNGKVTSLFDLGGGIFSPGTIPNISEARAISGDGTTIVGYRKFTSASQQANYKRGAQAGVLGDLDGGSIASFARACSIDGRVIVGEGTVAGEQARAFRWTAEKSLASLNPILPVIPADAVWSIAYGVSGDGAITVGASSPMEHAAPQGSETAVAWCHSNAAEPLKSLLISKGIDMTGWDLQRATGISRSGNVIVGYGRKNNTPQGFVITNALELFGNTDSLVPTLTIRRSSDHVVLQYATKPGFLYQLERAVDLASGNWSNFSAEVSSGTDSGPVLREVPDVFDETGASHTFYRLKIRGISP